MSQTEKNLYEKDNKLEFNKPLNAKWAGLDMLKYYDVNTEWRINTKQSFQILCLLKGQFWS